MPHSFPTEGTDLYVQTVLGEIAPDELGVTLSHEHVLLVTSDLFFAPASPDDDVALAALAEEPVTAQKYALLARAPYSSKDNLDLDEPDVAIHELGLYRQSGGCSIVDVTPKGRGRDPRRLATISAATGVNIVASTGWYIAQAHPPDLGRRAVDDLADDFCSDITTGMDGTDVKAGVIGELGCSDPLHPDEEKVLRAGARAQARTGAPLTLHPAVFKKNAHLYLDILQSEGADLSRVYVSHMDGSCPDIAYQCAIMDRGASIDYDLFRGTPEDDAWKLFGGDHWISDDERVDTLARLCALGYESKIMLAQDVCLKIHLKTYGGKGFAYVLDDIVSGLADRGVTDDQIQTMLVDNPKRMFTFS